MKEQFLIDCDSSAAYVGDVARRLAGRMSGFTPDGVAPGLKAALIDMDGVLYDSMKYHTLAWQRMISELGIDCSRDEFYLYEGMTGKATINLIFNRVYGRDATAEEVERLYARKARYFIEYGKKETMPGADVMLSVLMKQDIDRVLVTGSAQNSLLERLNTDYPGAFVEEKRVTAHDVSKGKPDAEPYLRGLEKGGVHASQAIVIENAPLGVQAGVAAGIMTFGITTGPIPADAMLEAGADVVFSSMPVFANALPEIVDSLKGLEKSAV